MLLYGCDCPGSLPCIAAVVFTFFALAATLPLVFARSRRADQVFFALAWAAFGTSALAFLFMIGICGTAKARFERHGFGARYGNLVRSNFVSPLSCGRPSIVTRQLGVSGLRLGPAPLVRGQGGCCGTCAWHVRVPAVERPAGPAADFKAA